eukprot:10245925-Karenia_brevis.AAC.1
MDKKHIQLMNGRAKACEEYPIDICKAVCKGIKSQVEEDQRRGSNMRRQDITALMNKLINAIESGEDGKLAL